MEQKKTGFTSAFLTLFAGLIFCAVLCAVPSLAFADEPSVASDGTQSSGLTVDQGETDLVGTLETPEKSDALAGKSAGQTQLSDASSPEGTSPNQQLSGSATEGQQSDAAGSTSNDEKAANESAQQGGTTGSTSQNEGTTAGTAAADKTASVTTKAQLKDSAAAQNTSASKADVSYSAHVQNIGWQSAVKNGATAGTSGKALRMEALKVSVASDVSGSIQCSAHVQNIGWQSFVSDGAISGTTGRSLRVEAVKIKLTGELAENFDVYYRCHVQNFGWLDWACNGAAAGSQGYAYRMEAMQIKLVRKGASAPGSTADSFRQVLVSYETHVQNVGWQDWVDDGATAGTTGRSLQVEALRMELGSGVSGGISYSAHVQNIGWQSFVSNGATAGTTGRSLQVEALKAKLTGDAASSYDLYYRCHVENIGWLDWACNGAAAGTSGLAYQVEAVQVKLVPKGSAAPGSTSTPYVTPSVSYRAYEQGKGWTSYVSNGATAGAASQTHPLEAFAVKVSGLGTSGGVEYAVSTQDSGWQSWASNGATAGSPGSSKDIEAVRMRLTGSASSEFDLYYRCYVQDYGWLDWASNGSPAGTRNESLAVEALQVKLVLKGNSAPGKTLKHAIGFSYFYLDSGHGYSGAYGYDPGAQGSGYSEATETAELVGKIAQYAKSLYGLDVYDNTYGNKDFRDRQDEAESLGCTAFVSIHFNAAGGSGTETYASAPYGADGSKTLQNIVHTELVEALGLADRGQKDYGYTVLCGSVPAVLCEIAFIDNSYDMSVYKAKEDKVAKAIAKAMYIASQQGF